MRRDTIGLEGKMPPQAKDIEEIVLGTIILESSLLDRHIQNFNPQLFYVPENQQIAKFIIELYNSGKPVDLISIATEVQKSSTIGIDLYYLTGLTQRVASSANFDYHFALLSQYALLRGLIQVSSEATRMAFQPGVDVFSLYDKVIGGLEGQLNSIVQYKFGTIKESYEKIIRSSKELLVTGYKSGVPTGFYKIDRLTNGWQNSDLIILAGRPSMGKTATAVSMIVYPAVHLNIPIAIFSLEMSEEQLVGRLQSSVSGVDVSRVVKKQLSAAEIQQIEATCHNLQNAPIFIDDTANISVIELRAKARRLVKEHGVKMIVVDYLQLMRSGRDIKNREQEIAEISKGLKAIAKELNIPVIALSQLSRAVESRGAEKKPQLSDLRESGQIEQDADMVLFCWRPEYYGIQEYELDGVEFDTSGLFLLIVSKHRNGGLGEIPLSFIKSQAKIADYNPNNFSMGGVANENNSVMFVQQNEMKAGGSALDNARGSDWLNEDSNNQNQL